MMRKILNFMVLGSLLIGPSYGSVLEEDPFPFKGRGTHYTFEEFSEGIKPVLKTDPLKDDFHEGFKAIFKHGEHRVSAQTEIAMMNILYRKFKTADSEKCQRKILFECLGAPDNSDLIKIYCVALHQRITAWQSQLSSDEGLIP